MKLKVQGYDSLVRDTNSNAIINTNKKEYELYMNRIKSREKQSDEIRNAVKEINTLKTELQEIKNLLKEVIKK
jgi:DNA-binding transcriptional regulator YhcF (GntR family)